MRASTLLLQLAGALTAPSPEDCTTPLGVPCMIVESVHEQRSVMQRGIKYLYSKGHHKTALASDGSTAIHGTFEEIPLIGSVNYSDEVHSFTWPHRTALCASPTRTVSSAAVSRSSGMIVRIDVPRTAIQHAPAASSIVVPIFSKQASIRFSA